MFREAMSAGDDFLNVPPQEHVNYIVGEPLAATQPAEIGLGCCELTDLHHIDLVKHPSALRQNSLFVLRGGVHLSGEVPQSAR